jgi:transketolase
LESTLLAAKARALRKHIIEMTTAAQSGHPTTALSSTDILTALYFEVMRHDPKNPGWPDRDRLVLSKGHGCPALYAALAESGYFPFDDLKRLRQIDSHLQGHCDREKTPGVEASTGCLGQGLSMAVGMALAAKLDRRAYHVYAILGDGECEEGQVWEAAMSAAHYKLDNLTVIVDRNYLDMDGNTEETMALDPLSAKWRAFRWHALDIDGHSLDELVPALRTRMPDKPVAIIAKTVKGKGVSFLENKATFHGKPVTLEDFTKAIGELQDG